MRMQGTKRTVIRLLSKSWAKLASSAHFPQFGPAQISSVCRSERRKLGILRIRARSRLSRMPSAPTIFVTASMVTAPPKPA